MFFFKTSMVGLSLLLAFSLYEPIPHDIHDFWHIWKSMKIVSLYRFWYILNGQNPWDFDPLETFNTYAPSDPEIKIRDDVIDGVPVRFYDPVNRKQKESPLMIYIHGGWFTWGSVRATDKLVHVMTKQLNNMLVASIEYRKAPKHRFPVAHDDCLVAVKGILKQHERLGFNLNNVALMGTSAGGNLVAVLSQQLKPQNPEMPHPIKSTEDLSNLPKAYIQACEFDPLRDDAFFYEKRLREAGVNVKLDVFPRTYHSIFSNLKSPFGQKMFKNAMDFIKENLNSD